MSSVANFLDERIAAKVRDAAPVPPMPVVVSYRDRDLDEEDNLGIVTFRGDLTQAETCFRIISMARAAHALGQDLHIAPHTNHR